jgi:spermidine synthase
MNIEINVPDGVSGDWKVETFEVSSKDAEMQRIQIMKTGRGVKAGIYKKLVRNGTLVMSNTPDEIRDFSSFVHKAKGKILVNGLGIGVLLKALLNKDEVTEITVIEKSKDVINLVAETYLKDNRVTIINECAFEYKPPKEAKYDCVWHDIWDYITEENLPEMKKLTRKYGKKADYQESWCRSECQRRYNESTKYSNRYSYY